MGAGKFITFEGGEGAGKSTQVARLVEALRAAGVDAVATREPGGAPGAEEIRAWLYARHPQLDGRRAIDLIHEDRSEEVLNILDRLDADVYL